MHNFPATRLALIDSPTGLLTPPSPPPSPLGGGGGSSNEGFRLAQLLTQLIGDYRTKSVWSSILNVLGRNKQLCARMPKFKDSRKAKQTNIFNGWTDEREPRSPLADLFGVVVPLLQDLKKKRGAILYPPPPPYPELATPPAECVVGKAVGATEAKGWSRPKVPAPFDRGSLNVRLFVFTLAVPFSTGPRLWLPQPPSQACPCQRHRPPRGHDRCISRRQRGQGDAASSGRIKP